MSKKEEKKNSKQYKIIEEQPQVVGLPTMEYSVERESTNYLPDEILIGAMKYAKIARERRQMIPNNEVYNLLSEKLGWK